MVVGGLVSPWLGGVEVESGDPEGEEGQAGCGGARDHLFFLVLIDWSIFRRAAFIANSVLEFSQSDLFTFFLRRSDEEEAFAWCLRHLIWGEFTLHSVEGGAGPSGTVFQGIAIPRRLGESHHVTKADDLLRCHSDLASEIESVRTYFSLSGSFSSSSFFSNLEDWLWTLSCLTFFVSVNASLDTFESSESFILPILRRFLMHLAF